MANYFVDSILLLRHSTSDILRPNSYLKMLLI
jgi:hypothetical protein